jgi:inositol phosphorylceramide mannosyltransferase catalytic subunit
MIIERMFKFKPTSTQRATFLIRGLGLRQKSLLQYEKVPLILILVVFFILGSLNTETIANSELQQSSDISLVDQSLDTLLIVNSQSPGFFSSPFWESMEWKRGATDDRFFEDHDIEIVEENFKKFCTRLSEYSQSSLNFSIPPIIHFIWLGSPIPSKVWSIIGSWERYHSGWEIMIWTDEELMSFIWSSPHSLMAFEQAESWAEKSDILRYEILYQFGGIYSDTDVVCFKSFHDLVSNNLTFFAGLELNEIIKKHGHPLYLGTAVMGAIKGSSIMKYCIEHFKTHEEAPSVGLVFRAGPGLMSRACHDVLTSDRENILILPCSYFYPLPYKNKWITPEETLNYISPESFTVHLWDGSWLK